MAKRGHGKQYKRRHRFVCHNVWQWHYTMKCTPVVIWHESAPPLPFWFSILLGICMLLLHMVCGQRSHCISLFRIAVACRKYIYIYIYVVGGCVVSMKYKVWSNSNTDGLRLGCLECRILNCTWARVQRTYPLWPACSYTTLAHTTEGFLGQRPSKNLPTNYSVWLHFPLFIINCRFAGMQKQTIMVRFHIRWCCSVCAILNTRTAADRSRADVPGPQLRHMLYLCWTAIHRYIYCRIFPWCEPCMTAHRMCTTIHRPYAWMPFGLVASTISCPCPTCQPW